MGPTALIPQITVVFPSFTKAEPSAVLTEPEKTMKASMKSKGHFLGMVLSCYAS